MLYEVITIGDEFMQKKIIILVLLTLLLVIITFIIFIKHDDQSEYPTTGRDLHEYFGDASVITSYSIHYTKLYESSIVVGVPPPT